MRPEPLAKLGPGAASGHTESSLAHLMMTTPRTARRSRGKKHLETLGAREKPSSPLARPPEGWPLLGPDVLKQGSPRLVDAL